MTQPLISIEQANVVKKYFVYLRKKYMISENELCNSCEEQKKPLAINSIKRYTQGGYCKNSFSANTLDCLIVGFNDCLKKAGADLVLSRAELLSLTKEKVENLISEGETEGVNSSGDVDFGWIKIWGSGGILGVAIVITSYIISAIASKYIGLQVFLIGVCILGVVVLMIIKYTYTHPVKFKGAWRYVWETEQILWTVADVFMIHESLTLFIKIVVK